MAVMLKDKLKTRFMIDSMDTLMEKIILEIVKQDVVDIAHVNFTPSTMKVFMRLLPKLEGKVIDSFNEDRNAIIQENFRRLKLKDEVSIQDLTDPLDKPKSKEDFVKFVNSLERGSTYRMISSTTLAFDIPFVVYLQLVKPSVNVDLGTYGPKVFEYITETLYSRGRRDVINSTDNFMMLYSEDGTSYYIREVTITEKDVNKEFTLYPLGKVTWTTLIDNTGECHVIPADFGKISIMKDEKLKLIYKKLYERCLADLNKYEKLEWKTLYSFIQ